MDDDPQADATIAATMTTNRAQRVQTYERVLIRDQAAVQIDCPEWRRTAAARVVAEVWLDRFLPLYLSAPFSAQLDRSVGRRHSHFREMATDEWNRAT